MALADSAAAGWRRAGAQGGVGEAGDHRDPPVREVAVEAVAAVEDHEPVGRELGPHGLAEYFELVSLQLPGDAAGTTGVLTA